MKTLRTLAIVTTIAAAQLCTAQRMDASRYRDYMAGLDASTEHWQKQISAIDIGRLKVSYTKGKMIEDFRRSTLRDLKGLHLLVAQQRLETEEPLSRDIEIEEAMADAYIGLEDLLDALPSDGEGSFMQGSVTPTMTELQEQRFPLRSHVSAYADELQSRAKRCSK